MAADLIGRLRFERPIHANIFDPPRLHGHATVAFVVRGSSSVTDHTRHALHRNSTAAIVSQGLVLSKRRPNRGMTTRAERPDRSARPLD
jgi:hypothetical protein